MENKYILDESDKMEKIRLGRIVNAVGLKGELKVYPYTDYKEKFEEIDHVIIDDKRFDIEGVRYLKNLAILKLQDIDDRTEAEAHKEKDVFILRKDAPPLPDDTYYVKDLVGLSAIDENAEYIGRLHQVIIGAAHDIYIIEPSEGKLFPVPAVDEFIKKIDMENGTIQIKLIEGLREL